jgi:hypothetical protein
MDQQKSAHLNWLEESSCLHGSGGKGEENSDAKTSDSDPSE